MKLIYIYLEDDYKHIKKGGYSFDNEFLVEKFECKKDKEGKKLIKINTNKDYHSPFNNSINNITCIVGRNGIGKTTFFELLIAPLLWRLDGEVLVGKLHLLFYDKELDTFVIESYIDNAESWAITLDNNPKKIRKNLFTQNDDGKSKKTTHHLTKYGFSILPYPVNIIFHSLSPFDRIYTLLKKSYLNLQVLFLITKKDLNILVLTKLKIMK